MIKIPDKMFGREVEGSYSRWVDNYGAGGEKKEEEPKIEIVPAGIENLESYIRLDSKIHGKHTYPDMLVSMGTKYGDKNWNDAHKALKNEGSFMLNIRSFVDFLDLLKSGIAFDDKGGKIDSKVLEKIYDEIVTQRDPWRAEWLDAKFKGKDIIYHLNGKEIKEVLEDCLMEDKTPGIDLDFWIKYANNQGLPKWDVKDGSLYYWNPKNGKVAGFWANFGWVGFGCGEDPLCSGSGLRVRPAKIFRG